jgi:hypothetical protein
MYNYWRRVEMGNGDVGVWKVRCSIMMLEGVRLVGMTTKAPPKVRPLGMMVGVRVGGGEKRELDAVGTREKNEVPQRTTWNLECSARHKDLWVDEGDVEGRRRVKELVGRMIEKAECPVDKLEEEKRWRGCEWEECGAQS